MQIKQHMGTVSHKKFWSFPGLDFSRISISYVSQEGFYLTKRREKQYSIVSLFFWLSKNFLVKHKKDISSG